MTLEELNRALLVAPFHRWLNLRMVEADAEHILIEMPWRDEMISNPRSRRCTVEFSPR